jgi:hypothetical protein
LHRRDFQSPGIFLKGLINNRQATIAIDLYHRRIGQSTGGNIVTANITPEERQRTLYYRSSASLSS